MKTHSLIYFLAFTFSLVIGYTFSIRIYNSGATLASGSSVVLTAEDQKSISSLDNGQRSILLIGADSLISSTPRLQSVWLAAYIPSNPVVHLLPIYPSANNAHADFDAQLASLFRVNTNGIKRSISQDFSNYLQKNNYWWSGYIIFDDFSASKMLDSFSGIEMNRETQTGNQVSDMVSWGSNDGQKINSSSLAIVKSICNRLIELNSALDLIQMSTISPNHILTDLDTDQMRLELQMFSENNDDLICSFPTLEVSRIEP